MQRETSLEESLFNKRKHAVHGHLVHLRPGQRVKLRWFVYLLEDMLCLKQYIGSTTDICSRWSSTKSDCNKADSNRTGPYKHFQEACPNDTGRSKSRFRLTLVDFYDTTEDKLRLARHEVGPQCRCNEWNRLKTVEDKWILRMWIFYGDSGLNKRDEFIDVVRGNYQNWFNFVNFVLISVRVCWKLPGDYDKNCNLC